MGGPQAPSLPRRVAPGFASPPPMGRPPTPPPHPDPRPPSATPPECSFRFPSRMLKKGAHRKKAGRGKSGERTVGGERKKAGREKTPTTFPDIITFFISFLYCVHFFLNLAHPVRPTLFPVVPWVLLAHIFICLQTYLFKIFPNQICWQVLYTSFRQDSASTDRK